MSKKKISLLLSLCVLVIFIFSSCTTKSTYKFIKEKESIIGIHISTIHFDNESMTFYTNDVKKVGDVDTFLQEFSEIDCYVWWGDPVGLYPELEGEYVIKVLYSDDEYELIHWNGQAKHIPNEGNKNYIGNRVFDEKQFDEFIEKYLN